MPNKLQIRTHINTLTELQPVLAAILRWANSEESSFAGAAASSAVIQDSPDGSQLVALPIDDDIAIVFRHNVPGRDLRFDITGGSGTSVLTVDRSVDLREDGTFAENIHAHDFDDGTFVEKIKALATSDGTTITMTLEADGGGDLTMVFDGKFSTLDTTPAATIALTPGLDNDPLINYIYILESTRELTKSISDWPSTAHIRVALILAQSASLVNTRAVGNNHLLINQNWNDEAVDSVGRGHLSHITEKIRHLGATWHSGTQGVATQDGNDLWVSISAGEISQLHHHDFLALDSDTAGAGDVVCVINDPDAAYAAINSLNEITKHSDGSSIGVNKYVKFVLWAVANRSGSIHPMMINLPTGEYNSVAAAATDVDGKSLFSFPAAFDLESSTGFLIAAFVCKHTASAMEIEQTIDLRRQDPSNVAGGGTGGGDVTAAATLTNGAPIVGDGGAKGVKTAPNVSGAEFGYLNGVTAAIQGQLNGKADASHGHDATDIGNGDVDNDALSFINSLTENVQDHMDDSTDPHGPIMTVTTGIITPSVAASGDLTANASDAGTTEIKLTNLGGGVADVILDGKIKPATDIDLTAEFDSASERALVVSNVGAGTSKLTVDKLAVTDTDVVANLNADRLDGNHASAFATVVQARVTRFAVIFNPVEGEEYEIGFVPAAVTMVKVWGDTNVAATSVVVALKRSAHGAEGTDSDVLSGTFTPNFDGEVHTSFVSSGAVGAENYLKIVLGAVTGTPTKLRVALTYDPSA